MQIYDTWMLWELKFIQHPEWTQNLPKLKTETRSLQRYHRHLAQLIDSSFIPYFTGILYTSNKRWLLWDFWTINSMYVDKAFLIEGQEVSPLQDWSWDLTRCRTGPESQVRPDLNGRFGEVVEWDDREERWKVSPVSFFSWEAVVFESHGGKVCAGEEFWCEVGESHEGQHSFVF